MGSGGPRQAEETIEDRMGGVGAAAEAETAARNLLATWNMSLETWARLVLQRHRGCFATHYVFAFLVFNMAVRSRNCWVSMLSVKRKKFADVESIV